MDVEQCALDRVISPTYDSLSCRPMADRECPERQYHDIASLT
jgi:hypothetical protein